MNSPWKNESQRAGDPAPLFPGWSLPALFIAGRLILFISLPLEGLRGFGDFVHFYRLAGMGWPFFDHWVEFPPVFPFLSSLLFRLANGREHTYDYLLALLLLVVEAASLAVFIRLTRRLHRTAEADRRSIIYFTLLLCLPYGWWYFDPLAVLAALLGVYWLLEGRDTRAAGALSVGLLVKLFPAVVLVMAWLVRPFKRALYVTVLTLSLTALVYGVLWAASPAYTSASVRSQGSKGSWETPWALLDGNLNTGNFGPESERINPTTATLPRGNPPRLPGWLTLIPFAVLGGWFFWQARIIEGRALSGLSAVAFLGLAWTLFLLWSPGWSPQWVLYLLPLILLALPAREGALLAVALVFINVLEWPVLLSRGLFWGLWLTIPVRTLLFLLMVFEFWKVVSRGKSIAYTGDLSSGAQERLL